MSPLAIQNLPMLDNILVMSQAQDSVLDGLGILLHLLRSDNIIFTRFELLLRVNIIPTNQHGAFQHVLSSLTFLRGHPT